MRQAISLRILKKDVDSLKNWKQKGGNNPFKQYCNMNACFLFDSFTYIKVH